MNQLLVSPLFLLSAYCLLILLASLAGGWIPLMVRLTHTRLQVAICFVAGFMLGTGMLHMLPHAYNELQSIELTARWLLAGFIVMFFIQRFLHFHHHDVPDEAPEHSAHSHARGECKHHDHQEPTLAQKSAGHLSSGAAGLGLTFHTLINGIALGASVEAAARTGAGGALLGFSTFLVIILHKPFDAMAISTLMAAEGRSRLSRHIANGLFALAIPLGVLLFHFGLSQFSETGEEIVGGALAFAAGTFFCIAASDLLPELQFHAHDRIKLSVALLLGLFLSALIGLFETSGHEHHHPPAQAGQTLGLGHAPLLQPPGTSQPSRLLK